MCLRAISVASSNFGRIILKWVNCVELDIDLAVIIVDRSKSEAPVPID